MLILDLEKSVHTPGGERTLELQLSVGQGELLGISGPSGSGKTTLLRLVAGLIRPERGRIRWREETWVDRQQGIWVAPQRRPVGLVFQDYALFPHMTVLENLRFALPRHGQREAVDELVELMELGELTGRRPAQLSGGQQQRVALARALVRRPQLLLLDEPLSALDAPLRARLQQHIRQLHKKYGLTTLLVSHDVREIHMLADRVMGLRQGVLQPVAASTVEDVALWAEVLAYEPAADGLIVTLQLGDNRLRLPVDMAAAERYPAGARMPVQAGFISVDVSHLKM